MPKISLTDDQVRQIISILSSVTVRVSEAGQVMQLIKALQTPMKEEVKVIKKEA